MHWPFQFSDGKSEFIQVTGDARDRRTKHRHFPEQAGIDPYWMSISHVSFNSRSSVLVEKQALAFFAFDSATHRGFV